jgi:hypothetical protein
MELLLDQVFEEINCLLKQYYSRQAVFGAGG